MVQNDVDYLMQMEDRERVINTLCAKLIERQQIEYDDEDFGSDEDYDEQIETGEYFEQLTDKKVKKFQPIEIVD